MRKYLKDCEFMKSLIDDLVVMCDEIVDATQSSILLMEYITTSFLLSY